jgi:pyruvate dehydrogenase E2 component (dihydrolipoamide acetyltransferase)
MPELLSMPEVAAGAETATLCEWFVRENQQYAASDILATIETDKAVVDFTADADGVLLRVLVEPGTEAEVGAPIALIAGTQEKVDDIDAALAMLAVTVVPALPSTMPDQPEASAASSAQVAPNVATSERLGPELHRGQDARIFISPLARRLAHDAGVTIESITPTGPNGRIGRRDVELVIARQQFSGPPAQPTRPQPTEPVACPPPSATPPSVTAARPGQDEAEPPAAGNLTEIPHSRVRRAIAQRLTESKQTIPHFYMRGTAQVDDLLELRARLNESSAAKISVNDFVMKAAAHAHQLVPAMNVIWTDDYIRKMPTVDLGAAVATDSGLVTPVLRGVDGMPISVVSATTRDLAERAREGRLYQHELEGGSSTVTNLGMYGTEEFAAIINPPQSSILAVGTVRKEPVVTKKGNVRIRSVIRVTLSVDHRPIDGAIAAQWMRAFLEVLERPIRLLV